MQPGAQNERERHAFPKAVTPKAFGLSPAKSHGRTAGLLIFESHAAVVVVVAVVVGVVVVVVVGIVVVVVIMILLE